MKKVYVKPEIVEIEVVICSMQSTSFQIDDDSQGDFGDDFVRGRRGVWGDLWADDVKEK